MARPTTGAVIPHVGKDGRTYRSIRFSAYGKRRFVSLGAVSLDDAEESLRHTLADVERGVWQSPVQIEPPSEVRIPTFHVFAEAWWTLHQHEFAPKTHTDYRWRLESHLLPFFETMRLDTITVDAVERYIAEKVAEGARIRAAAKGKPLMQTITDKRGRTYKRHMRPLSPRAINMTVILLGAILESAVERELISRNPAKGKRRRMKEKAPSRSYVDSAAQISALLDAAGELDREATKERAHVERRAMLAVLVFAGLRIGELCALRWRDIDLADGWIHTGSKTDAGYRVVKIRGALRDELTTLRGRHQDAPQDSYVFSTRGGGRFSEDNVRSRVLGHPAVVVDGEERKKATGAVGRALATLDEKGLPPLPSKLTPHSLRRTFASLLYALGEDPGTVMDEMGHTDPGLALRIYRQSMRRGEDEQAALTALVEGDDLADSGRRASKRATSKDRAKAA